MFRRDHRSDKNPTPVTLVFSDEGSVKAHLLQKDDMGILVKVIAISDPEVDSLREVQEGQEVYFLSYTLSHIVYGDVPSTDCKRK